MAEMSNIVNSINWKFIPDICIESNIKNSFIKASIIKVSKHLYIKLKVKIYLRKLGIFPFRFICNFQSRDYCINSRKLLVLNTSRYRNFSYSQALGTIFDLRQSQLSIMQKKAKFKPPNSRGFEITLEIIKMQAQV